MESHEKVVKKAVDEAINREVDALSLAFESATKDEINSTQLAATFKRRLRELVYYARMHG